MRSCAFCNATLTTPPEDSGWEPYFYMVDREISQPVCGDCRTHIRYNEEHGDYEAVREHYPVYTLTFTFPGSVEVFSYLAPPPPDLVAYLTRYRPSATAVAQGVVGRPGDFA